MAHSLVILIQLFLIMIGIWAEKYQYQKRHFHYQTLYSYPSKPVSVKSEIAASYSHQSLMPIQIPTYEFGYKIHDPKHGNYQIKKEKRIGDAVEGYYSLLQPNGEVRVVRYHSDESGFHSKVPLHKHNEHSQFPKFS